MFVSFIIKITNIFKEIFLCFLEGLKVISSLFKTRVAFVLYSMFIIYIFVGNTTTEYKETSFKKYEDKLIYGETLKLYTYDACVQTPQYNNSHIALKVGNLNKYFSDNYPNSSIIYYDINTGYKYTYNKDKVYFGASLIKTLSALYIYEKALINESILDKKLIYLENYLKHSSVMMGRLGFGDQVSIRDLVNYSISVSDNTAYQMLLEYIGFDNLKAYGHSIGNKYTLEGNDRINGKISPEDAFNYMRRLYSYINNNDKLGQELRGYFKNNYALYFENKKVPILHKSGDWIEAHHDIAIIEDENPFIIIVLTNHGQGEKVSIKDISTKIYSFHEFYTNKQEQLCNVYKN